MTERAVVLAVALLSAGLGGCAAARVEAADGQRPAITFPARYSSPREPAVPVPATAAAGGASKVGFAPDPKALSERRQWEFMLRYERGAVTVSSVSPLRFAQPVVTERRIGRFALELWIGRELIERVRFDFPLVAADPAPVGHERSLERGPELAPGATSTITLLVPDSDRATRLVVVDRATGGETQLPWPPAANPGSPASSGERR